MQFNMSANDPKQTLEVAIWIAIAKQPRGLVDGSMFLKNPSHRASNYRENAVDSLGRLMQRSAFRPRVPLLKRDWLRRDPINCRSFLQR